MITKKFVGYVPKNESLATTVRQAAEWSGLRSAKMNGNFGMYNTVKCAQKLELSKTIIKRTIVITVKDEEV